MDKKAGHLWFKTTTKQNDLNPVWNESGRLSLPELMPRGGKILPLMISVWDSDAGSSSNDDLLGEIKLTWEQVSKISTLVHDSI